MHSVPFVAATRIQSALSGLAVSLLLWSVPGLASTSDPAEFYSPAAVDCGDSTRQAYEADVANGLSDAELEARYGQCRTMSLAAATVTNFNTTYERMNSCGWHPQAKLASCDVEIRQNTGYNPYPSGSTEYVLFCLDCNVDGIFEYSVPGSVHVTNNVSGTPPSWYHMAYAGTSGASLCKPGDGKAFNVRAILSWASKPSSCNYRPIWGSWVDFKARRDP